MAINVMNLVWKTNLTSTEKLVLLALADHASLDGTNVYPGTARLVRMTRLSERWVRKIRRDLIDRGLLIETEPATPTRPAHYRIDLRVLRRLGKGEEQSSPPEPASAPDESSLTPLNPVHPNHQQNHQWNHRQELSRKSTRRSRGSFEGKSTRGRSSMSPPTTRPASERESERESSRK